MLEWRVTRLFWLLTGTIMCFLVNLFGCINAVFQIDEYGRRKLMLLGAAGTWCSGSSPPP
jgi:hypothetical protein